jgi:hypothetical protein
LSFGCGGAYWSRNIFEAVGINERDYMRRRDPKPGATPFSNVRQGVMVGLCIVIGAIVIGSRIQRNQSLRQSDVEENDIRALEAMLRPPAEPPVSIKRLVDINTATAEELDTLPYVGESTAASIMTHRPYKTIDELDKVPGISKWKIDEIRPYVMVSDPE